MGNVNLQQDSNLGSLPNYKAEPGEEYMSEKQLEHFRNKLLTWKSMIMQEVDGTVQHMKKGEESYTDALDRASQEENRTLELRKRNREFRLIQKIDEALKRIDLGGYGYCLDTGEEISLERLDTRPTSELCIAAKTLREAKENAYKV